MSEEVVAVMAYRNFNACCSTINDTTYQESSCLYNEEWEQIVGKLHFWFVFLFFKCGTNFVVTIFSPVPFLLGNLNCFEDDVLILFGLEM